MFEALRGQREALRSLRPETLLLQMYSLKVALACGLGAVILAGGDERFSAPALGSAKDLVAWTGANPRIVWGLLFLAIGVALIWALGKRVAIHILRFGLVVYMFFVVGLAISVFRDPAAGLMGIVVFTVLGAAHALLSVHLEKYGWQ